MDVDRHAKALLSTCGLVCQRLAAVRLLFSWSHFLTQLAGDTTSLSPCEYVGVILHRMNWTDHETQTNAKANPAALLLDPRRVSVSMSQAASILGIAKSSAHKAVRETGQLCDGLPVLRIGKRQVVSTFHLRALLGVVLPDEIEGSRVN